MNEEGKTCNKCKRFKPYTEYSKDKRNGDGRQGMCKKCCAERTAKYRVENLELVLTHKRESYDRHPLEARQTSAKYRKTESYKIHCTKVYSRAMATRPEKVIAAWKARYAVKTGRIIKKPCEVCGEVKVEGHHDDYSKPLEVRWLCKLHHDLAHGRRKFIYKDGKAIRVNSLTPEVKQGNNN